MHPVESLKQRMWASIALTGRFFLRPTKKGTVVSLAVV